MKFDLSAFKAWVGGLFATAGIGIANLVIHGIEAGFGFDIPANLEGYIITAVSFAVGYFAVYFAPNKTA